MSYEVSSGPEECCCLGSRGNQVAEIEILRANRKMEGGRPLFCLLRLFYLHSPLSAGSHFSPANFPVSSAFLPSLPFLLRFLGSLSQFLLFSPLFLLHDFLSLVSLHGRENGRIIFSSVPKRPREIYSTTLNNKRDMKKS